MIDAHCHLLDLVPKFTFDVIKSRAVSAGIRKIITCSCSISDWKESERLFGDDQFVSPQFGVHPWWSGEARPDDWLDNLRNLLTAHPKAGVGEIGIDKGKKGTVPMPVQIDTFKAQLRLAQEMDRTSTIHCVNAYGTLIDILRSEHSFRSPVVIHSFSGSGDQVRELMKLSPNIYLSVSGRCPKTDVIPFIPLERMLLETDAPFMPITSQKTHVGTTEMIPKLDDQTNDSSQLLLVADRVATALGKPVEEVQSRTLANTMRAFQIESLD